MRTHRHVSDPPSLVPWTVDGVSSPGPIRLGGSLGQVAPSFGPRALRPSLSRGWGPEPHSLLDGGQGDKDLPFPPGHADPLPSVRPHSRPSPLKTWTPVTTVLGKEGSTGVLNSFPFYFVSTSTVGRIRPSPRTPTGAPRQGNETHPLPGPWFPFSRLTFRFVELSPRRSLVHDSHRSSKDASPDPVLLSPGLEATRTSGHP